MTTNKHAKQLVRARMAATGETYTKASAHVRAAVTDIHLADPVTIDVHGKHGQTVAFTPDGTRLYSGGQDARIAVTDPRTGEPVGEFRGHEKVVNALAITPDGNHTLESGQGPLIAIRDADGEPTAELDTGAPGVIGLDVAPDGARVATAGYHGTVGLWSCDTWELLRELPVGVETNAIAFSRDGRLLAAAAAGRIVVWSHQDDDPIATYELPIKGVYALAFSRDSRQLAQTGADGKVRNFNLR